MLIESAGRIAVKNPNILYTKTMNIPSFTLKLPVIPDAEQTSLVRSLLQLIAQRQQHIQRLEDEIQRLEGGTPMVPVEAEFK